MRRLLALFLFAVMMGPVTGSITVGDFDGRNDWSSVDAKVCNGFIQAKRSKSLNKPLLNGSMTIHHGGSEQFLISTVMKFMIHLNQ